jgi:hypothetical protein
MRINRLTTAAALLLALSQAATAFSPIGTSFTYQGELKVSGQPATGSYDMQFKLFDALAGGTQVGQTASVSAVAVAQGRFTAPINPGTQAYDGQKRWLEIAVRPAGSGGYTTLAPRQEVTPTPHAALASSLALPYIDSGSTDAGLFANGLISITQNGTAAAILGKNSSQSGAGIYGYNTGQGPAGKFENTAGLGTALSVNCPSGTAIRIQSGGLKVDGAGIGSDTPVFIHQVTAGNIAGNTPYCTFINNPYCNGQSGAVLLVTFNWSSSSGGYGHPYGVYYEPVGGHWHICSQDGAPIPVGTSFNVLVFKP